MLRLKFSIELKNNIDSFGCDFFFSIHAAQTAHQIVVGESLGLSQNRAEVRRDGSRPRFSAPAPSRRWR
jgi:hypothetical protein